MAGVEGTTKPQPTNARAPSECQSCFGYLSAALDRIGSRPRALLKEIGAVSPGDGGGKFYRPSADGQGVLVDLKRRNPAVKSGTETALNTTVGREDGISQQPAEEEEFKVTLVRRLTKAANLLALQPDDVFEPEGVLTTSPAAVRHTKRPAADPGRGGDDVTTIAIECRPCGTSSRAESGARAFVMGPEPLSIVLCSNRMSSQSEIEEVLVHELVHIYDVHSRDMDLRDCRTLAYSEVRSAREAECSGCLNSFFAGICTREKATVATRNIFPERARQCVASVFDDAFADHAPFAKDGRAKSKFLRNRVKSIESEQLRSSER